MKRECETKSQLKVILYYFCFIIFVVLDLWLEVTEMKKVTKN